GRPALLAVLAFPGPRLDAALDEHQRALAGVLGDDLGQVPFADVVRNDVVVVGELLALALRSRRPAVCRDAEIRHRGAARRIAHLRVLGEPSDEQGLVEIRHLRLLPMLPIWPARFTLRLDCPCGHGLHHYLRRAWLDG